MSISEYGTDMRLRDDVSFHANSRKSSNSSAIMNVHACINILCSVLWSAFHTTLSPGQVIHDRVHQHASTNVV